MKLEWAPSFDATATLSRRGEVVVAVPFGARTATGTARARGAAGFSTGTSRPRVRAPKGGSASRVHKRANLSELGWRVYVGPDVDRRYRLNSPVLALRFEEDEGTIVVSDHFSSVYGVGGNNDEAVKDYLHSLFDYFEKLEDREPVLARGLRQDLAELRRHIVSRQ